MASSQPYSSFTKAGLQKECTKFGIPFDKQTTMAKLREDLQSYKCQTFFGTPTQKMADADDAVMVDVDEKENINPEAIEDATINPQATPSLAGNEVGRLQTPFAARLPTPKSAITTGYESADEEDIVTPAAAALSRQAGRKAKSSKSKSSQPKSSQSKSKSAVSTKRKFKMGGVTIWGSTDDEEDLELTHQPSQESPAASRGKKKKLARKEVIDLTGDDEDVEMDMVHSRPQLRGDTTAAMTLLHETSMVQTPFSTQVTSSNPKHAITSPYIGQGSRGALPAASNKTKRRSWRNGWTGEFESAIPHPDRLNAAMVVAEFLVWWDGEGQQLVVTSKTSLLDQISWAVMDQDAGVAFNASDDGGSNGHVMNTHAAGQDVASDAYSRPAPVAIVTFPPRLGPSSEYKLIQITSGRTIDSHFKRATESTRGQEPVALNQLPLGQQAQRLAELTSWLHEGEVELFRLYDAGLDSAEIAPKLNKIWPRRGVWSGQKVNSLKKTSGPRLLRDVSFWMDKKQLWNADLSPKAKSEPRITVDKVIELCHERIQVPCEWWSVPGESDSALDAFKIMFRAAHIERTVQACDQAVVDVVRCEARMRYIEDYAFFLLRELDPLLLPWSSANGESIWTVNPHATNPDHILQQCIPPFWTAKWPTTGSTAKARLIAKPITAYCQAHKRYEIRDLMAPQFWALATNSIAGFEEWAEMIYGTCVTVGSPLVLQGSHLCGNGWDIGVSHVKFESPLVNNNRKPCHSREAGDNEPCSPSVCLSAKLTGVNCLAEDHDLDVQAHFDTVRQILQANQDELYHCPMPGCDYAFDLATTDAEDPAVRDMSLRSRSVTRSAYIVLPAIVIRRHLTAEHGYDRNHRFTLH